MHKILFYIIIAASYAIGCYINPTYSSIILILYLLNIYFNGPENKKQPDLTNKVAIVTGGLSGIGFATVQELVKLNAKVIICGRMSSWRQALEKISLLKKQSINKNIEYIPLDLDNQEEISKFIEDFKKVHPEGIDLLINNAGISTTKQEFTKQNIEINFGVNHIGHFQLTLGLLDQMNQKCRIINVSSKLFQNGNIDFNQLEQNKSTMKTFNSSLAYSNSKLANILFTKYLQLRLNNHKNQIKCVCLHPGVVRTNLFLSMIWKFIIYLFYPLIYLLTKSPYYGCQTTLYCCTEDYEKLIGGGFYSDCQYLNIQHKQINMWAMKKLWDLSLEMCGKKDEVFKEMLRTHEEINLEFQEDKKNQ